jgi:two-component system nitrogen regulation sensor histidine kinase GlnL
MISTKVKGSGLGLSITQGIISQHNGTVRCNSEPGKTIFSILIPVEKAVRQKESKRIHA